MDIGLGIAGAGHAWNVAKLLVQADKELSKAELKAQLAEVMTGLADARIALLEAQEALREKDAKIAALEAAAKAPPAVFRCRGFPFRVEDGSVADGPYCPNCYEQGSLVLLGRESPMVSRCARCKGSHQRPPMVREAQAAMEARSAGSKVDEA